MVRATGAVVCRLKLRAAGARQHAQHDLGHNVPVSLVRAKDGGTQLWRARLCSSS